jgi:dynein heavy chain
MDLLDLCQHSYGTEANTRCIGDILMIDFKRLRQAGPLDQHQLKNNVTIELDKSRDFIKNNWFASFMNIFADKSRLQSVSNSQLNSFYDSVKILASNQLKDILLRTIQAWCDVLKPENHLNVPIIRMELTFDDNKMQFYPMVSSISDLLNTVVEKIANSIPGIQTVKGFINNEANDLIDTSVADHYIKDASAKLKNSLEYYLIEPKEHLQSYSNSFWFFYSSFMLFVL